MSDISSHSMPRRPCRKSRGRKSPLLYWPFLATEPAGCWLHQKPSPWQLFRGTQAVYCKLVCFHFLVGIFLDGNTSAQLSKPISSPWSCQGFNMIQLGEPARIGERWGESLCPILPYSPKPSVFIDSANSTNSTRLLFKVIVRKRKKPLVFGFHENILTETERTEPRKSCRNQITN